MYKVFRETTDIRDSYAAATRAAVVQGFPNQDGRAKTDSQQKARRWSRKHAGRAVARGAFRALKPAIRPIAWRLRSFLSQPTFDTAAQISANIERGTAMASARADKNEAMLAAISRELRDVSAEVAALRAVFDNRTDE